MRSLSKVNNIIKKNLTHKENRVASMGVKASVGYVKSFFVAIEGATANLQKYR